MFHNTQFMQNITCIYLYGFAPIKVHTAHLPPISVKDSDFCRTSPVCEAGLKHIENILCLQRLVADEQNIILTAQTDLGASLAPNYYCYIHAHYIAEKGCKAVKKLLYTKSSGYYIKNRMQENLCACC